MKKQFMTAQTGNVATDAVSVNQEVPGPIQFAVWGTWGGATVAIEFSPDDGTTWVATGLSATQNTLLTMAAAGRGQWIFRANVSSGVAHSVNAAIII